MTPEYLSPQERELIRSSFRKVAPKADQLTEIFYGKLFELDGTLRPLFGADLTVQRGKLGRMFTTVIGLLDKPEVLLDAVAKLGERHVGYGIKAEDFDPVGQALVQTLATLLDSDFNYDVEAAWLRLYTILSSTMSQAFLHKKAA
jgi:hemoglobin-like flavoprotein